MFLPQCERKNSLRSFSQVLCLKYNHPITGLHRPLEIQDGEAPRIPKQSARVSGKFVSPTHWSILPPGDTLGKFDIYKVQIIICISRLLRCQLMEGNTSQSFCPLDHFSIYHRIKQQNIKTSGMYYGAKLYNFQNYLYCLPSFQMLHKIIFLK